jgi:hypothetical protein
MKPAYNNIAAKTGSFTGGINQIKIAPRDWVQDVISADFATGKVIDEIYLFDNKKWLVLECSQESLDLDEKPKGGRSGEYVEITIQGSLNDLSPEILQTLETLKQYELIAIIRDNQKRFKVVGDTDSGLILRFSNKETSAKGGTQICNIDLSMQSEYYSPFYEI